MKEKKDIHNPIFFIGMGRSGSSVIYEAFTQHPNFAFFSQYCTKLIKLPELSFIHRFFKYYRKKEQWQKQHFFEKFIPNPKEAYVIWANLCGIKFRNSFLRNKSASKTEKENVLNYIKKLLVYQGKYRFITKTTGPPRINYLASIFENPFFIDIVRDPRSVVFSLLNIEFRIKKGLTNPNWIDSLTVEDEKEWKQYNNSAVALAALEWRSVYRQTEQENNNDINYLRIKYEDFILNPTKTVEELLQFTGLDYSEEIVNYIGKNTFKNTNYKYKDKFSKTDIEIINQICKNEIKELGYS